MSHALRCVPGTLCDAQLFGPLLARLGGDGIVVPLVGASVASAADALIDAAPPGSVAVGFSLGGFVVLDAVRRAPGHFAGAVLIASHAEPDTPAAAAERARQAVLFERGAGTLIDDVLPRVVAERASKEVHNVIRAMAVGFDTAAFAAQAGIAASRSDSRGITLGVPSLVIAGTHDRLCPPERARATADGLGSDFATVDAGHFVPLEAPDAVAAAIAAWLVRLDRAAAA